MFSLWNVATKTTKRFGLLLRPYGDRNKKRERLGQFRSNVIFNGTYDRRIYTSFMERNFLQRCQSNRRLAPKYRRIRSVSENKIRYRVGLWWPIARVLLIRIARKPNKNVFSGAFTTKGGIPFNGTCFSIGAWWTWEFKKLYFYKLECVKEEREGK